MLREMALFDAAVGQSGNHRYRSHQPIGLRALTIGLRRFGFWLAKTPRRRVYAWLRIDVTRTASVTAPNT